MSMAMQAAATVFSVGAILGSCWLIYVHLVAYADLAIEALLLEAGGPVDD